LHIPRQELSRRGKPNTRIRRVGAILIAAAALLAIPSAPAMAAGGGTSVAGPKDGGGGGCGDAKLRDGKARPPDCAPERVKKVIWAANRIAKGEGYCYGGGHSSFKSSCYDCSGAVSYALHGGHFVKSPMPSSGYYRWGKRGKGDWFTVYTNSGHAFLVVAGLRFDTSMTKGAGPGWSANVREQNLSDFKKRHKKRF
jgi:hypothetical protein